MYTLDDFISLMKEMIQFFDEMTAFEQQKLDIMIKNDLHALEECVKQEQVFSLRFRGLDKKREQMLKDLSLEHLSFREILERLPDQSRDSLSPVFSALKEKMDHFQDIRKASEVTLQLNLDSIEAILTAYKAAANPGIYTKDGVQPPVKPEGKSKFSSKKV